MSKTKAIFGLIGLCFFGFIIGGLTTWLGINILESWINWLVSK